jgi:hypothetical protein
MFTVATFSATTAHYVCAPGRVKGHQAAFDGKSPLNTGTATLLHTTRHSGYRARHLRPFTVTTGLMLCYALFVLLYGSYAVALGKTRHPLSRNARFAILAIDRLDADFLDQRVGLYTAIGGGHGPFAALWPTSQVLAGAIAVARLTGETSDRARVRRIIASLGRYGDANGGFRVGVPLVRRYYDDNCWIGLDLLDAYDLLHDSSLVREAEQLFSFLITGWDPVHGGIRWATDRADLPTAATAPAITIAARLAILTGRAEYRDWALRLLRWEDARLRDPTGLYWDHIGTDGTIDRDTVSYNQGTMIDALVEVWRLTGETTYLARADHLAKLSEQRLPGPRHKRGQYAAYDAIYYRALRNLDGWSPEAAGMKQAQDFVSWAQSFALYPRPAKERNEPGLLEEAAFVITAATIGR